MLRLALASALSLSTRDALARVLYQHWCDTANSPKKPQEKPDWEVYDAGDDLNGIGLTKISFEEDAAALLAAIDRHGLVSDMLEALTF